MSKPVCTVVGVGPGNGAACARRFAAAGYATALLARSADYTSELASELPGSRAYACDVTSGAEIASAFAAIREDLGDVEHLIYNAGSGAFGSIDDTEAADFEEAWRINALGGFLAAKEVIPTMQAAGHGSIVFTGATASLRGGANFTAFAAAKAAQRSLAQSMARHLGPSGIHVCLVIVDGVIDLPRTREFLPDRPDSLFLQPADIAETTFQLTQQNPSAWTFEIDLRPAAEKW